MIDRKQNREFGILLSLVLVLVSAYTKVNLTIVIITALTITLLIPQSYTPLTWLWIRSGEWMSWVVTRCVLFLLFFGIITPISLFRRWMGKDPFRLRQFGKSKNSVFLIQEKTFRDQDLDKQY